MRKLQQFFIPKFPSGRLANSNYTLTRTLQSLKDKKELVSLADSQVLRTIRKLTNHPYNPTLLSQLLSQKRQLLKSPTPDHAAIHRTLTQISNLLYIPEYILVTIESKKHYREIIRKGITLNNIHYTRLLCSAGMARNNTVAFTTTELFPTLVTHLRNGADPSTPISKSKFNAYFALSSTATHTVSTPYPLLIPDCEIEMTKMLDWVNPTPNPQPLQNREYITSEPKTLTYNLFDGGGLIDITLARQWAEELNLSYTPSVFIIRNIYIKGCLFTVDFRKFATQNSITHLTDLYGNSHPVSSINVILTKSQFKLSNAYTSFSQYQSYCDLYSNHWGVARVSPQTDDPYFFSNYQFLQVLNLTPSTLPALCDPTVQWLTSIAGLSRNHALLYLLGSLTHRATSPLDLYNQVTDPLAKALIINPNLIQDSYIRQTLINSINKKIKEAYIGKLLLKGNFSTMIPDPYALLQHTCNLPVTGLLQEFQHYSNFWLQHSSTQLCAMRSPLTWRSEVNLLNLQPYQEWYQYITSGTIYNVWGTDCIIAADSDFDGDLIATTDNQTFLQTRYDNLPISYPKSTTPKETIKLSTLYKADLDAFDTAIGQITNYSTSFYDLLHKFPPSSPEHQEIINRLKLTRKAQGDEIDKAKGIKSAPYPSHWIRRQSILPTDPPSTVAHKEFLNSICADKKPYFFIYRYPQLKKDYDAHIDKYQQIAALQYQQPLSEALASHPDFNAQFQAHLPVIDYNSPMNQVCHYMEEHLSIIPRLKHNTTPPSVISLLQTSLPFSPQDLDIMDTYCKTYYEAKKTSPDTLSQFTQTLQEKALIQFGSYEKIANILVEYSYIQNKRDSKSFAWTVFGSCFLHNLILNSPQTTSVPLYDPNGSISYLYSNYSLQTLDLSTIQEP